MSAWYQVNPEALKSTADGINQAVEELGSIASVEGAEVGRGFDSLELAMAEVGDPELQKAFAEFCERWTWGVRALVQEGDEIAKKLHLAAGVYHDQEKYVSGTVKDLASAMIGGNPNLSEDQVEKTSWHRVLADNAVNERADYSAAAFHQSFTHQEATLKSEEADLLKGPVVRTGMEAAGATSRQVDDLSARAEARAKTLDEASRHQGGGH